MLKACNRVIEYSFYGLFLLVPLAFTSKTSELFELNKMWFTWGLTIIIVGAWLIKMVLQKKFIFQRTPLDIPIGLFLLSQVISTIFSLDVHTSIWGYYSRFNGGLLSIVSYIILYYAFLSNVISENSEYSENQKLRQSDNLNVRGSGSLSFPSIPNSNSASVKIVKRLLLMSLVSGLIVALWGLPSHFGYDPTCLLFRGTLDVSCWTADFLPKVRIFSTLGQPDWLAAYLAILIPIAIAFLIQKTQNTQKSRGSGNQTVRLSETLIHRVFRVFRNQFTIYYLLFTILLYVALLYTLARSGFLAIWIALAFFAGLYYWAERKRINSSFIIHNSSFIIGLLLLITFFIGTPITQLRGFTLDGVIARIKTIQAPKTATKLAPVSTPAKPIVSGGTESADIRRFVWEGAINAWKANPIFGTGVETFAFAYYKHKPAGQNLTSEWNFLYNKAHNEYLNFLATTGIVGLGSYLLMIGSFLFLVIKKILFSENSEYSGNQKFRQSDNLNVRKSGIPSFPSILTIALIASYLSILVTNFFGFSVVITNVYLFMIPALVFVLTSQFPNALTTPNKSTNYKLQPTVQTSIWQWTPIFFILITGFLLLFTLFRFWQADVAYALGANLNRAGEYQQAYPNLHKAVAIRGSEPVFKDELSINNAMFAANLLAQKGKDTPQETLSIASSLAQEAINTSNEIISQYQNNAVFWKTRTKLFYTLSQIDSRYFPRALDSIEKASLLAPNDANIRYNLGVLYGQNNNLPKGIEALEKTIALKPDYRDAHYALGLFYHQAAVDKDGKVTNSALQKKALSQMQYILDHISPNDSLVSDSIKSWEK